MRRRTVVLGALGIAGAVLAGGGALSYYNANRPCACTPPPPPSPAPGLAELRAAVTRFNNEHGWAGTAVSDDTGHRWSDSSGKATALRVVGDLDESVAPARMAAFIVGLHEAVDGLLVPPGSDAVPLQVRVELRSRRRSQDTGITAEIASATDHDVLAACMSVASEALDGGAASAMLAGETLALRHPDPDGGDLLDPAVWLSAAPASLPAGVVLEQQRDYDGNCVLITRMMAGDDMSEAPLADLAETACGLRWYEATVESAEAGAVVRLSEPEGAGPRSDQPLGVEDLRGVLDLARTGTWARWILADGGDGYRGVIFECTDGTLSVPEAAPALAGPGISLERSREVLAELGCVDR